MKKLFLLVSIILAAATMQGQEVVMGVLSPGEEQGITVAQSNMLQSRMEKLCTSHGITVVNIPDGFFLYPTIAIVSDEVAEGGMRNIYTIKAEVTLSVRRIGGDVVATMSQNLSGSGYTKSQATTSLIQSLNVNGNAFDKFISDAKSAMVRYYQSQCKQVMFQADQYAAMHDYRTSIATLCQIPANAPCFSSVGEKMKEFYAHYQSQLCNSIKMNVESALATHDYEAAASLLAEIDPSSECYEYAINQFQKIEKEVAKIENRDWNFKMKQYNDAVTTERRLIDACRDVAKAYYSSTPTVHYTQVIR